MKTSHAALSIALCALLITPAAFAQAQPPASSEARGALPPASDAAAPSLAQQADLHFGMAADAFAKADYERAAEEIRKGADFVELASFRTRGYDRIALRHATADLRDLATFVEGGTVEDRYALEVAFARADRALARLLPPKAAAQSRANIIVREELKAAGREVESAAVWAGNEVRAGATWTRDEVAKAFASVRRALHVVDNKIVGSGEPASPFDVGA